jgi:hypothetical protein
MIYSASASGVVAAMTNSEWEAFVGLSPAMSVATDELFAAGMLDAPRLRLLRTVESNGEDPVALARHLVKLNRALR